MKPKTASFGVRSFRALSPLAFLVGLACAGVSAFGATDPAPVNLARTAHATAFESFQGMTPDLAIDGKPDTRWSGIPGHNSDGWFELAWDHPVRVGEVVVRQYDTFVKEMDLEVWDDATRKWLALEHLGRPEDRLPVVVSIRFEPRSTTRVRLARITNGPSFNEVEVYSEASAHPPVVSLASDLRGGFLGMVCDQWGGTPLSGVPVTLSGAARAGAWEEQVRTDPRGLFFAPMPLGLTGAVVAALSGSAATGPVRRTGVAVPAISNSFDALAFAYGLTPPSLDRSSTILSGPWRFAPDPPAGFERPAFDDHAWPEIQVPSHFEMQGFHPLDGVGGYRLRFRTPGGAGRLKLRFDGVYSGAEVWVNGQRVAYHEGGALPFEADLTEAARPGENLLAVRVSEHTPASDLLDKMSQYADFPLAGIMRPVSLFRVPALHLGSLDLECAFDAAYHDATLSVNAALLNQSDKPSGEAVLEVRLVDRSQGRVMAQARSAPLSASAWQRAETKVVLPVAAPRHWDAEHPELYVVEAVLQTGGRTLDRVVQKFGFRQTQIRDGKLLINGQPVKIRGTCHHDSHPLMGRAVTAELERQDLELMKEANLNSLRTSHYPPLPALLDFADELGIYVEDEGSFCWAEGADDLRLTPRIMQMNAELLARDRNHPSVFIWSVCNESAFGYGFERSHEWLKRADPSRPHAGSYDRGSLDVLAWHNPISLGGIDRARQQPRPLLWDEAWCIFQGIFRDVGEMWLDPGVRDYYAVPLPAIYERMMQTERLAGSQIWAWSDDLFCVPGRGLEYGRGSTRTHFVDDAYRVPGRGLVGDAPWGVVDGWRRKKPEFWITRKLHSPIKIAEKPLALPAGGETLRIAVENQYDFTDLSELSVLWETGFAKGKARVSAPPHTTGELKIPFRPTTGGSPILSLKFEDRAGRLVDEYHLRIGAAEPTVPPQPPGRFFAPLRVVGETSLAGTAVRVVGDNFELCFDEGTGLLRRGTANRQALLLEAPRLHVLPTASPFGPLPVVTSWHLEKLDVKPGLTNVEVRVDGRFEHFAGGYRYEISPSGAFTARASFQYHGPKFLAREVGLAFSVPRDCDLLRWSRQAEWSAYPEDHIGRPLGSVRAFVSHPTVAPPTWPWAEDNSPMGCNDFRSEKRHIDWASLGYTGGLSVRVVSDGSQHFRAMVDSDRIVAHVNDWYGGSNVGWGEWTSNYGEGKVIEDGQHIESTVRFEPGGAIR